MMVDMISYRMWTDKFNGHQILFSAHNWSDIPQYQFLDYVIISDSVHRSVTYSGKELAVLAIVTNHSAKTTRRTSSKGLKLRSDPKITSAIQYNKLSWSLSSSRKSYSTSLMSGDHTHLETWWPRTTFSWRYTAEKLAISPRHVARQQREHVVWM